MASDDLDALLPAAHALEGWLRDVPHAWIGGLANAFRGEPRMTMDIDGLIVIDLDDLDAFLTGGEAHGFVGRHPATADFGRHAFLLRMVHTPTITPIDLAIGITSFEREAVDRAQQIQVAGGSLPIIRAEHLLVMKAFAHRDKDMLDVAGILARNPGIDLAPVRRWLRILGEASEEPSILTDFEALLQRIDRDRRVRDALASGDDHA